MILRVMSAAVYGFLKDDCYTKASALTFYTLQSIVPFLAAAIGIAKGFGFNDNLEQILLSTFSEQKEIFTHAFQIADSMLSDIRGGVIAGFGILFLFWTNINLLGYIEDALNQIWKIKIERNFIQKLKDYLAIIILCPIILVASSGLTVFFRAKISELHSVSLLAPFSDAGLWLFKLVPTLLSCLLFFLLYFLMPNTKISFWPRFIASIIAGIAFQFWQYIFIALQIKIFNYNAVYGSFALLPLFLIWLQVSWLIALAGAEISSHIENDVFFDLKDFKGKIETINKKQLGLLIIYYCTKTFYDHTPPMSVVQISQTLKVPLSVTQDVIDLFMHEGILTPIKIKETIIGYHPLYDPSRFTIKTICDIIDRSSDVRIVSESTEPLKKIIELLNAFENSSENSQANLDLRTAVKHLEGVK